MMFEFSEETYINAIMDGTCDPPCVYSPFICVDKTKYNIRRGESKKLDLGPLRKRLGQEYFKKARGAMSLTLKHSQKYFPAYQFIANEFLNEEWLSTVDWHKFHRDHAVHQSMTAYMGMELLNKKNVLANSNLIKHFVESVHSKNGLCGYLMDYLNDMGAPECYLSGFNKDFINELWTPLIKDTFFLAALFHDLGYPWRFVNIINNKLRPHSPLESPAGQSADWISARYGKRLVFYPLYGYSKTTPSEPADWQEKLKRLVHEGLTETHGMPGAISFLHLNDVLRKYPEEHAKPVRQFCIEWAAMAIMMHDMAGIYANVEINGKGTEFNVKHPQLRLRFSRDPLSWLLTFCDVLQEFERPNAEFSDDRTDKFKRTVKVKYISKCKRVELDWKKVKKTLKITYVYSNYGDYALKINTYIPKEQLHYFDPQRGYLDFSDLGINQVVLDAKHEP